MGLLRAFGLIAIIVAAVIGYLAYVAGTSAVSLVPMIVGAAALCAVLPFPAYERAHRTRVTVACLFYTAAAGLSFVLVTIGENVGVAGVATAIAPATGAALSVWALRTRTRRRVIGYANYYKK